MLTVAASLSEPQAHAQTTPAPSPPPAAPPRGEQVHRQVTAVDFADEPVRLETVGLTMRVPAGATIQTSQAGTQTTVQVMGPESRWLMIISTPRVGVAAETPTAYLDRALLEALSGNTIKDQRTGETIAVQGSVTARTPNFSVPGSMDAAGKPMPGERASLSIPPTTAGGGGAATRRTLTVFRPTDDLFCVIELLCPEAEFAAATRVYELAVATAVFSDPGRLAASRRDAALAGIAFLRGLTAEAYERAAADTATHWYRVYRPAQDGGTDEEVAYRSLRVFKGTRAQIDPKVAGPGAGGPAVSALNPAGYLVEIGARQLDRATAAASVLGDAAALHVYDIRGLYFVSADRQHEAWSLTTAIREGKGKPPAMFSETGTRDGTQMTVLLTVPGKPLRTIRPTVPPEGYVSQAEVYLLPRLIVQGGAEGGLGLYAYHTASGSVVLRRDGAARSAEGTWALTSRPNESGEPMTATVDAAGRMVLAHWPGGLVVEPLPLEEIVKRWSAAGLPTGSLGGP